MTNTEFSTISSKIPALPGIYKYYNAEGTLIYVGKAKHLRKRVSSYFSKSKTSYKTAELVQRIHKIEFTIVDNESDAFLLENQLIKKYQPFYNISLKDDKTYPYIVIKNEPFPRVFFTRKKINDGSKYFGPYTSIYKVRELLNFLKEQIPLRTCKLNLTQKNIESGKFKVCLEFHLGNCKGPCEGFQTKEDYDTGIIQISEILKGNLSPVVKYYKDKMQQYSDQMEFEKAADCLNRLNNLMDYQERSVVINNTKGSLDVFSILEEGKTAYVNYLHLNEGAIINTKTVTIEKKLEEEAVEVLMYAISELRETFESDSSEIIVPFPVEIADKTVQVTVPKSGAKFKLLQLSQKNVNHFKSELQLRKILKLEDKTFEEQNHILQKLQQDLHLPEVPLHIECFDNSNVQGHHPVAAMVCFKNGVPDKNNYRKFKIKTVSGINDFASMKEVVFRRYKALTEKNELLPQLVIIDGGKGQLNAAIESIHALHLQGKMTIVGLAKNQEEIFYPGDRDSLKLPWDSESLKLIRRIRDEVHRFAITFHRDVRSKQALTHTLEHISGIGLKTSQILLKKFKSLKNVQEASEEELIALIGKKKTGIIRTYFNTAEK